MRRLKKKIFLGLFGGTVLLLGAVRTVFPEVAGPTPEAEAPQAETDIAARDDANRRTRSLPSPQPAIDSTVSRAAQPAAQQDSTPGRRWHPVRSVPSYAECFPDVQDVQIVAARRWGVRPVLNRKEAERRRRELVYIGASPFYSLDEKMIHSIPYLVPRASHLLTHIARSYMDSLYQKGIPLHQIIVTSVLRTQDDVLRLQQSNGNATEQSCHLFGTTFDICYNRFTTVSHPDGPERRPVQNDTLKWVLSEVLRDVRQQGRCYIKYEVKQGCFHITVR